MCSWQNFHCVVFCCVSLCSQAKSLLINYQSIISSYQLKNNQQSLSSSIDKVNELTMNEWIDKLDPLVEVSTQWDENSVRTEHNWHNPTIDVAFAVRRGWGWAEATYSCFAVLFRSDHSWEALLDSASGLESSFDLAVSPVRHDFPAYMTHLQSTTVG